jgi:hypothetical protein
MESLLVPAVDALKSLGLNYSFVLNATERAPSCAAWA